MFTSVSLTFFVNFSHLFLQSMIQKVFFIVLHDKSYCYTKESQGKKGVPSPLKYTLSYNLPQQSVCFYLKFI